MIIEWSKRNDYWTNIGSPDFGRDRKYRGYLETLGQESSGLIVPKKNGMWHLRDISPELLRQDVTKDTGFIMRRHACVFGDRGSASTMPELRKSENRESAVDSDESLLHKAFCFLCGAEVPSNDHQRCVKRAETGLACSESLGQRVYAGTASEESCSGAPSNRDRRNIPAERAYLSDCGKRSGAQATDLVRRGRSL